MEEQILKKIEEQELKIDEIHKYVKKIHLYFKITFWVTVVTIVLPLIGLMFVIPMFINSFMSSYEGLL